MRKKKSTMRNLSRKNKGINEEVGANKMKGLVLSKKNRMRYENMLLHAHLCKYIIVCYLRSCGMGRCGCSTTFVPRPMS